MKKTLGIRKLFSRVIGLAQTMIGVLSTIFAYLMYYNFLNVQGVFNLSTKSISVYTLVFVSFGLFSAVSGLFLVHESFED